jgi:predicted nuclease of predicted toxin-antitoxin system
MKLLLDQGLPRSSAVALRARGHDAVHVGDAGLSTADDAVILERARAAERVVITLDTDFHALLAVTGASKPSVIRVRIVGLKSERLTEILLGVLQEFESELQAGACISVLPRRVRVRQLPLKRSPGDSAGRES